MVQKIFKTKYIVLYLVMSASLKLALKLFQQDNFAASMASEAVGIAVFFTIVLTANMDGSKE